MINMNRLDIELIKRNLFKTRNKAKDAITSGVIFCNGKKIIKASFLVNDLTNIQIKGSVMPYVSKGGLKLEKALQLFSVNLDNKVMLDIGSSTGGFTDCALKSNIKKVIAVDVGTDQLDITLRDNLKVNLYEHTDIRTINDDLINNVDIATIDISFISIEKVLNKLANLKSLQEIICLIKPQFECGKEIADKYKGIVLDKKIHKKIILSVIYNFSNINFFCNGITYSPITGGHGNIEYLVYFLKQKKSIILDIDKVIDDAFLNFKT